MPKLPILRSGDVLRHLLRYGCVEVSIRGSHHKLMNPANGFVTAVPVHSGIDMKKGTLAGILAQLGIGADEFLDFIR